jgi:hypothetical protein
MARWLNRIAEDGYFYECRVVPPMRTEGIVITVWPITDRSFAADVPDTDHPSIVIFEAALSISRRSSDVSLMATEPMFSSRRDNLVVPGFSQV